MVDVDGGCVPIGLPMRELLLELIRLFELTTGCCVTFEGIQILLIRVFVRLFEFVVDCLDLPRIADAEFLEFILPDAGLLRFELIVGREDVERLDVILVELGLGRLTLGVLAVLFRLTERGLLGLAEGWGVLGLGGVLLRLLLALADCWALGAGADFGACCLAAEELLDFLLFWAFCAKRGSLKRIKAEASTIKANVIFCWFFGLYMILLLSFYFI